MTPAAQGRPQGGQRTCGLRGTCFSLGSSAALPGHQSPAVGRQVEPQPRRPCAGSRALRHRPWLTVALGLTSQHSWAEASLLSPNSLIGSRSPALKTSSRSQCPYSQRGLRESPHRPTRGHAHRQSRPGQVDANSAPTHRWGVDKRAVCTQDTRRPHSEAVNQRHTDCSRVEGSRTPINPLPGEA